MHTPFASLLSSLVSSRKDQGLTQTDLATRLGLSQPQVAKLESSSDPRLSTLQTWAGALGLEVKISLSSAEAPSLGDPTGSLLGRSFPGGGLVHLDLTLHAEYNLPPLTLLSGAPGAGKSYIASLLLQGLPSEKRCLRLAAHPDTPLSFPGATPNQGLDPFSLLPPEAALPLLRLFLTTWLSPSDPEEVLAISSLSVSSTPEALRALSPVFERDLLDELTDSPLLLPFTSAPRVEMDVFPALRALDPFTSPEHRSPRSRLAHATADLALALALSWAEEEPHSLVVLDNLPLSEHTRSLLTTAAQERRCSSTGILLLTQDPRDLPEEVHPFISRVLLTRHHQPALAEAALRLAGLAPTAERVRELQELRTGYCFVKGFSTSGLVQVGQTALSS